jgi:cytochrome c-type biogenesis protein CcmH/NrfF
MPKWSSSAVVGQTVSSAALLVLALIVTAAAQAQPRVPSQQVDVRRVGARLACQCGCPDTVASCSMMGCPFSPAARDKIAKMQAQGSSDAVIIDDFVKAYGPGIFRAAPNALGWLIPYLILAMGTVAVIWFVIRSRRPKPQLVMDSRLAQYNDQIEKELQNLDR